MLESLAASLLNRFLGSYIENFDTKQLNIGIWNGDVKLKNLRLKKESLDKLKLPIDVKFGHLGELTLQIPWSNLKGKPVKVIIEDVYLLASPIVVDDYDEEEDRNRQLQLKKEKLQDLELIDKSKAQTATDELSQEQINKNESFTESLITKIVDNVQVTIKNIHIRYEDQDVLTEHPYSIGITLEELSAVSTDDLWTPSFIAITQAFAHKLLKLKSLSCYWNTESESIYTDDSDVLLSIFKDMIVQHSDRQSDSQFLLKPVSGNGKLTVNKAGTTEKAPHVKAELFFEEFGIDLDSDQYRDALWTSSKFHWYMKTYKYRKLRPKVSVQENPKEWFRYAAKSILNEIHEKNYKWSWEFFKKRKDQRLAYVKLWKEKLANDTLSTESQHSFDQLEIELSYEDIKFYRSLARSQYRKERLIKPKGSLTASTTNSSNANQSGWFSSWWSAPAAEKPSPEEDLTLTEEQKQELYDAIEYDEQQALTESIDVPRDRVKVELLASLDKGALSIRKKKDDTALAEMIFEGCTAQLFQRPDSLLANFQLQEFRVEDGTDATLYKHIVSVKPLHGDIHSSTSANTTSRDPFFKVSFEHNPLDGSADSILLAKLKSMTIFYNAKFIEEVVRFFTPPKMHLDTIGAIMNVAEATMEGFTSQTRIGLQYALEEHKTINTKLDLQAPLIILPLDPSSWKSPVAILDAGHISVISDLADKTKYEEIKSSVNFDSELSNQLLSLMYDKFNLHLQDAQFLIGPDIKSTMEQLHTESEDKPALLLDNLNIKLSLGISIVPEAYALPRFKIGAEVPRFRVSLNDVQYKIMMQIIEKCIPNFEDETSDDSYVFDTFGNSNSPEIGELSDSDEEALSASTSSISQKQTHNKTEADKQRMFEFDFKVEIVRITLLRCIEVDSFKTESLVDIIGDHLNLSFWKTNTDMSLNLVLTDINVQDHIEKTGIPEFDHLISSNRFNEGEVSEQKEDLFKLKYFRKQRIVEFNNKDIEVFDQDVYLDIATLKFIVTRKSLLTLLNFALNTFTDPNPPEIPADQLRHNDAEDLDVAPQKMNVNIKLNSIILVFNDDGIKLATLKLSKADIDVFLVPEEMKVHGRLGALTLHDEINQGSPRDSMLRNLISIQGDNLAEFTYQTFDKETNINNYGSFVEFKTGSIRVNFVQESFRQLLVYLSQFQRMKYIYDSAREAALDQAGNIDSANKLHFNVLVETPIIVFPELVSGKGDRYNDVTMYLGEFYAHNELIPKGEGYFLNQITTGVRNTRLTSEFHFQKDTKQFSEIINDLDIGFHINFMEEYIKDTPTISVIGNIPDINLNVTELQLAYLYRLYNTVPKVFDTSDVEVSLDDIENDAINANKLLISNPAPPHESDHANIENKADGSEEVSVAIPSDHTKVDLQFGVSKLGLTIYQDTVDIADFSDNKLSSFVLNEFSLKLKMTEDTHFSSDLSVHSFVVTDIRERTNSKFPGIIPLSNSENNQFVLSVNSDGKPEKKNVVFMLTIDSPKTIVALDYLFALKSFMDMGLATSQGVADLKMRDTEETEETHESKNTSKKDNFTIEEEDMDNQPTMTFGYSVNIINTSVILLADTSVSDSEAIVFKLEQLLITSQNITSLSANNIGMFLCRMDDFEGNRLRILDDFSASFILDGRDSTETNLLTSIQLSMEPLVMRLSLRDIRLALTIFNRANTLYAEQQAKLNPQSQTLEEEHTLSEQFKKRISQYAPTILSNISNNISKIVKSEPEEATVIIKGEELHADIEGFRLVLIGDVHELPVLDMEVKPFQIIGSNWSTDLKVDVQIESYINIFNYAKSSWEPLVEPWPIGVRVSRTSGPSGAINVDVVSRQLAEMTVSSRSIALLSQVFSLIYNDGELKRRGEDAPYRIVNQTGFDISIFIDSKSATDKKTTIIRNGDKIPWEFEDWRKVRENLSTDNNIGVLGIEFIESPYQPVNGISVTGEGEDIFTLFPPINGIHHRLSAEVILGKDSVKIVTLKSTITIENNAHIPVLIGVYSKDSQSNIYIEEIEIKPQDSKAVPIYRAYSDSIMIKPLTEAPFEWSENNLYWRHLLKEGASLKCVSSNPRDKTSFYFQAEAVYDADEPLAKLYPHMRIVISAPLEIENLLPCDFSYRLYDKSSKRDWTHTLKPGESCPVHVVRLEHFLLLSVEPLNSGFVKSEFAIISSPKGSEFKRETRLVTRNADGQKLTIHIHYTTTSHGIGTKVMIYSPYVIINRTGESIFLSEKSNIMQSHPTTKEDAVHGFRTADPRMFSFEKFNDRNNRALLKVSDSVWSMPLSLDAIGRASEVTVQLNGKQVEMNLGITVKEGEGKYRISKIVTITPRFVLRNDLDEYIEILEVGSTKLITVKPKEFIPLYSTRRAEEKSLIMSFAGAKSNWSSPFLINEIGQVFLKVYKQDVGYRLLKINILIEEATVFIQIEDANNNWPFSIKNYSDSEFYVYQSNPNIDENGDLVRKQYSFRPLYYKIPPQSEMPYAWDYPAGLIKELVLRSHGRERNINLAEIGNLKPFNLPRTEDESQAIVDLNVVANGPSQSLIISKFNSSHGLYKLKSPSGSTTSVNQDTFEISKGDENYGTKIIVRFEGLGVSLITTKMQELCYITVRGMEFRYNESDIYQNISMKLKWIQIDNQLFGGVYPILLYPTVVPQSGREMNNHPTFSASVSRMKDNTHGVLYIKYATLLLQEMSFEMDEDFLLALLDFADIPGASWNAQEVDRLYDENLALPETNKFSENADIYFEALHLQPTQLNLSFVRTDRINDDDKSSSQNTLMFFFNVLTMAIGNINDAPIKLNALLIENVRVPLPVLSKSIQSHYGQAFFYQVHKILGSADFLGNPVGLFNSISSGFMDIFYEPYQGFIMNDRPQELGIGLAKGGASFLKKSVFGFSDSIAKVTGSLAKGLTVVTFDKEFQEKRRLNQRRNKPKDAVYGFTNGATSFVNSLTSGVAGIATAPIEGASKEGAVGFFKGLGKGFIGLPTKTAIGFFDLASNVSEGIRNTTTVFDVEALDKIRLPRYVSHDSVVRPYSLRESQGQFWLKSINGGEFQKESYLAHIVLPGEEMSVLVSFRRIILADISKLQTKWVISYDDVRSISIEPTGIKIGLKNNKQGLFIPIPDRSVRSFIHSKIGIAVEEYNKHCQVIL